MKGMAVLALALLVCACSSGPVAVKAGDVCETCKKAIVEVKYAAEAITPGGSVLKFRTANCLALYCYDHPDASLSKYVTDFPSGRMMRPETATYVRAVVDENTREIAYVAFISVNDAVAFSRKNLSSPVDWLAVQRSVADKARKTN